MNVSEFTECLQWWLSHREDMTPTALSRAAGLDKTAIRQMIALDRSPRIDTAMKIFQVLGVTADQFFAKQDAPDRRHLYALLDKLTDDELALLLAAAQGLAARDHSAD